MRLLPFRGTRTLLLTNISYHGVIGVLGLFALTGSLPDKDGVLDLSVLFNCVRVFTLC